MCVPPLLLPNSASKTDPPSAPDTIPVQDHATASISSAASSPHSSPMATGLAMVNPTTMSTTDPNRPTLSPYQPLIPSAAPTSTTVYTSSPVSSSHFSPMSTA